MINWRHMKTEIQCPACEGSGHVSLPEHLHDTLYSIPKHGTATAEEIAELLGTSPNAQSNRLVDLLMLKLVTRKRDGKFWRYSR